MTGPLEASVTLEEVFAVVTAKRVPLAPELAGYLTLEIAEQTDAAGGEIDPRSVYVADEGTVALVRPRRDPLAQGGEAEHSIRAILLRLLDASGSQTPALAAAARRKGAAGLGELALELEAALIPVNRAAGRRALARLAREVKRVTLGVGRNARGSAPSYAGLRDGSEPLSARGSAPSRSSFSEEPPVTAKRDVPEAVLAGSVPSYESVTPPPPVATSAMHEANDPKTIELRRPRPGDPFLDTTPPAPHADEVDHLLASFGVSERGEQATARDLKVLAGLEPTPPPPSAAGHTDPAPPPVTSAPHLPAATDEDVEALLALGGVTPPPRAPAAASLRELPSPATTAMPRRAESSASMAAAPTAPSMRKVRAAEGFRPPRAPRTDRALAIVALVVLAAGIAVVWTLRPAFFTGRRAELAAERQRVADAEKAQGEAAAREAAARCKASLIVTDVPAGAEVLLRVGQAPLDVDRMPVGARLEFVATADGYAPKRTVVPAGATWDTGPDGKPRFEVAVQLEKSRARPGAVDRWPAGEPGSEVGGKGAPGTVHLVSTPRGAEVWLLAGIAPEARIDQLRCGSDVDVLVAGPTTLRRRLHAAAKDFVGTEPTATISAVAKAPGR